MRLSVMDFEATMVSAAALGVATAAAAVVAAAAAATAAWVDMLTGATLGVDAVGAGLATA
jgi:hypothetical protein